MEYLDRVSEAYSGLMGKEFQEKTRKRLDWVCGQVQGDYVLDIGCSQGICTILMGRQGRHVLGIDIAEQSIQYANDLLQKEPQEVRERVEFRCADFLAGAELDRQYDTVSMTEVLEHLVDPEAMVDRAAQALRDGGCFVVTVPFGINDFPDHKHTFYIADIYRMLSKWGSIDDIHVVSDGWVCFRATKTENPAVVPETEINLDFVKREEEAFFALERPLRDQIIALTEKYKKATENYQTAKSWAADKDKKIAQLNEEEEKCRQEFEKCREQLVKITQLNSALEQERNEAQTQCQQMRDQLLKSADEMLNEEKFLRSVRQQLLTMNTQLQQANKKNQMYEEKLNKVYNTWYGKIVLKAYKLLKKIKHVLVRK